MQHTYKISGMTCDGCSAKVSFLLKKIPGVTDVAINLEEGTADVIMDSHITTPTLREALEGYPKYQLSGYEHGQKPQADVFGNQTDEEKRSWTETYKPILLLFGYITAISLIAGASTAAFSPMLFMQVFMAGFFLAFSFFKMLNLKAFAESYAMYDVVAGKFPAWGYIYAFIELGLGIAFATGFEPVFTNAFTAIIMLVSLIGVLQGVLNKKKIQCACLGAVFNLPMSTVTIIEDGLMIAMSIAMLAMYL
ncbi:heavy-metal-associated domain-containing protein [uncultured Flavobacterium sp.]|uniref:heavy metal translocating P-type ATPase n=1 Tax=uncultured Flavobacterium sp. TaxID=165435 RepID=UPI0025EC79B1|nr:heavy-metal-associated domain-containing protein [uncultured Flavobacterium sp.]